MDWPTKSLMGVEIETQIERQTDNIFWVTYRQRDDICMYKHTYRHMDGCKGWRMDRQTDRKTNRHIEYFVQLKTDKWGQWDVKMDE